MSRTFFSVVAAALLATTAIASAQGAGEASGTTIVPEGQSAPQMGAGASDTAGAAGSAAAPAASGEAAAPADAAGGAATGETAAAGSEGASGDAAAASSGGSEGSGEKKMAEGETMKVDGSPSADTKAEGNAVTIGDLGKPADPAGNPTYDIAADGTADWYTWRGYKKYGANCLQCHGPDGLGSSFAPNLTDQLSAINYFDFAGIIVSGQQNKWNPSGNSVMPAWGEDPNVMCSLDAIYIYLRARADGVVGRGEPKRPEKTEQTAAAQQEEYDCLGF